MCIREHKINKRRNARQGGHYRNNQATRQTGTGSIDRMMARSPARVFGAGKDVFQMPPGNGKSGMRANPGAASEKAAASVTMMNLTKKDYSCFWKIFIGLQQVR